MGIEFENIRDKQFTTILFVRVHVSTWMIFIYRTYIWYVSL